VEQFWEFRELAQWPHVAGQGLLLGGEKPVLPLVPLSEPNLELLKAETELLGFVVSGHPLDLYSDVQWNTYCPIADVGNYPKRRVTVAGMIIEDRLHHQIDGRIMKFISVCDYSGILECELFASAYRRFGVETIRHPIVARRLPHGTASPRFIVNRRRTLPKRVQGRFASEKHRRLRRSTPFASCRKLSCIADLERLQICKSRLNRGDSNHRCSRRLPLELSLGSGANPLLLLQRGPEKTTFP
jgi:DNA polymerase III alpha subunit